MPSKQLKPIPKFETEDEEREFWATHSSSDYVDWSQARRMGPFPHLESSKKTISIRLPESLLGDLKALAKRRDVPYQSLMKVFLAERVRDELLADEAVEAKQGAARKQDGVKPTRRDSGG